MTSEKRLQASVIVPAFRRPKALLELIGVLRAQEGADFEIIVVEQSENPALIGELRALGDARLNVIEVPARGLAAARNCGARAARGDILIFVDDDDLPIGTRWVADHCENYRDPLCVGVAGRWSNENAPGPPPRFPRLVRRMAFSYTIFKDPRTFAAGSLRKKNLEFITFSNASVRRELFERVGGLDEGLEWGEEDTFAFKFRTVRHPGEYFVFDPKTVMWRRVDVEGGWDRRNRSDWHLAELARRVAYYHTVTARYFPWRFRLFYPLYVGRSLVKIEMWIWDPDNRNHTLPDRVRASLESVVRFPAILWKHGLRPGARAPR